jgi:hypothetical protein
LKTFDGGFSLYIQWFEGISVFTKRVKSTFRSLHVSKKASFVLYFQRPSKKGRTNDVKEYSTKPAAGAQKIETLGGDWAHLRNSPPSLLMIGNNYLKQLAFGARANSPVPICRLWNGFPSEVRISRLSVS